MDIHLHRHIHDGRQRHINKTITMTRLWSEQWNDATAAKVYYATRMQVLADCISLELAILSNPRNATQRRSRLAQKQTAELRTATIIYRKHCTGR